MKLSNTYCFITAALLISATGCGDKVKSQSTQALSQSDADKEESFNACQLGSNQIRTCIKEENKMTKRLEGTLKAYDKYGEWPCDRMDSSSFTDRYPIKEFEKDCLKSLLFTKEVS